MDSHDEPLGGRRSGETSQDLDRIPRERDAVTVADPVEADDWTSPRVADLVGWMVRRSETRKALEAAMIEGAFDGREHSQQFLALVDVAVNLSQLEAESSTPHPQSLDLRGTVEAAYRSLAGSVPASLVLRIDDDVPPDVFADPDQLERVLAALISIASPVDGGTATRIAIRLGVSAGLRADGATVLDFEVERSRSEDESSAGDPMGPSGSSPDRIPAAGRDLGLAICTEVVSLMGGDLSAEPLSAGGGRFRLALPAAARRVGVPG